MENTYEYLPGEVGYPFAFLGNQFNVDDLGVKDRIFGTSLQTIHIYHNDWRRRVTTTSMMNAILERLRKIRKTPNFYVSIVSTNMNVISGPVDGREMSEQLLHVVLEVEFKFY